MGWSALLKADLAGLARSWVFRGWLLALTATGLVGLTSLLGRGAAAPAPASALITAYLTGYLAVWSTLIIVLSAGSVSMEAEIVADSILSRACTRTQYLLAKLTARCLVTVGVYLVFSAAAGYVAWRYGGRDVTPASIAAAIAVVGLALTLLCSLGIALSVFLSSTIAAVVAALLLWYVAAPIFSFFGAEYLSPASLMRDLPVILRDSTAPRVLRCAATPSSLTVVFSKEMDPRAVEQVSSYVIEQAGTPRAASSATYDPEGRRALLTGLSLSPGSVVKVVVRGVTDRAGNGLSPAGDSASARVAASGRGARRGARSESGSASPRPGPRAARRASPRAPTRMLECSVTGSRLRVVFSGDLDAADAERVERFVVESPLGRRQVARAAVYDPGSRSVVLTGLDLDRGPVRVTARGLRDARGAVLAAPHASVTYAEVTPWKYLVGFGLPAALFALLSIVWFSRRDL